MHYAYRRDEIDIECLQTVDALQSILCRESTMQTPVTSESLTTLADQQGTDSARSSEVETPQAHVTHTMEKPSKTDFTSGQPLHERSKPIPFNAPTGPHEIVDSYAPYGRHLVQGANLADGIVICRLSRRATKPEFTAPHETEEFPELLDFSIDIEEILGSSDSLQQERPKGRVLKFEVPPHMKAMPPASFVKPSNSTGAAKVIEFRRPGQKPTVSDKQIL